MNKKEKIEKNVHYLSTIDLEDIFFRGTVREVGDEVVGFVTLLVDPKSGEIRNLSSKRLWSEDAVTIEALLKKKDLMDIGEKILIELLSKEQKMGSEGYTVLEGSLELFNQRNSKSL